MQLLGKLNIKKNNEFELSCMQLCINSVQFRILAAKKVERNAFKHTQTRFSCQIIAVGTGT